MRYGATNNPMRPVVDEIETLADLGFDYLELCLDPPLAHPDRIATEWETIQAGLERTGLPVPVGHLPTFVWLADIYPSIRRASVDEVVAALDVCARMGLKKAVLHPGYLTGLLRFDPRHGREIADGSLEGLILAAGERGVTVCLENMFPRAGHMYRPEEFAGTLATYPDLMMTLDLGHANIQAPPERLTELIRAGGRRIGHVHVSDNSGADDEHLPVGAGRVNVAGGLKALKALGYDDTITIEVFSPDRSYLSESLKKVKAIWEAA